MSIHTRHQKWLVNSEFGIGVSIGIRAGTLCTYSLVGDREKFILSFIGGGAGVGIGLDITSRSGIRTGARTGASPLGRGDTSKVIFLGTDRSAHDFRGTGNIIEVSFGLNAGEDIGFTFVWQFLFFNVSLTAQQTDWLTDMVVRWLQGRLSNLDQLRRIAPAFALIITEASLSAGGGIYLYEGRWNAIPVLSETDTQYHDLRGNQPYGRYQW
jgi:hypothetical protein